jgi:hypothetical protein
MAKGIAICINDVPMQNPFILELVDVSTIRSPKLPTCAVHVLSQNRLFEALRKRRETILGHAVSHMARDCLDPATEILAISVAIHSSKFAFNV